MIRFALRWSVRFASLALVLVLALYFFRDSLLRHWLEYRIRTLTTLNGSLGGLKTDLSKGVLTLSELRLPNAPEFGGDEMLHLPTLHLELDTAALRNREFRIRLAKVHIASVHVVVNEQGQTNLTELARTVEQRASVLDAVAVGPPGLTFAGIETLDLTFGTLRNTRLAPPSMEMNLNIGITNEVVREVKSIEDLAPVLVRVVFSQLSRGLLPEFKLPDLKLPDLKLPDLKLPDLSRPTAPPRTP